jgi:hypothetical protein
MKVSAKVQYSPDMRDPIPSSETLGMLEAVHPENVLAELLTAWRAGACAAGRRLVSEVDGLASHIRHLRAEIALPSVDKGAAE